MTRSRLHAAVAQMTGESLQTVRHRGFNVLRLEIPVRRPARQLCLSCPGCGGDVPLPPTQVGGRPEWAECDTCDIAYPYHDEELFLPDEELATTA